MIGGQYVALQIPGASETLAFCEIAVYTTLGMFFHLFCVNTEKMHDNISSYTVIDATFNSSQFNNTLWIM